MDPIRRVPPSRKACWSTIEPGYHIDRYRKTAVFVPREGPNQRVTCRQAFLHRKRVAKLEGVLYATLQCPKDVQQLEPEKWTYRRHPPYYASGYGYTVTDHNGYAFSALPRVYLLRAAKNSWGGTQRDYLQFIMDGEVWSGFAMGCDDHGVFRRTQLKADGTRPPLTPAQRERKRKREAQYRKEERARTEAWQREHTQRRGRFA